MNIYKKLFKLKIILVTKMPIIWENFEITVANQPKLTILINMLERSAKKAIEGCAITI